LWQRGFGAPIRSAPVAKDGKLFIITINNQLFALEASSGRTLWSHEGYKQTTSILGYPTPAIFENVLIAPYSSGELVALRTENGKPVWGETLALFSPKNSSVVTLNDIDASPVVKDGALYAVSHEGILVAIDILSGRRIWEQPISSLNTPWVAGDFLFVMTTRDELVCLHRADGKIKWVVPFVSYENEESKKDKIVWSGPVVAGGRIYVAGSHGVLVALKAADGAVESTQKVNKGIYQPPLVVGGSLYLIDNKAEIQVLR
jgi:outer membrane protein assembly factor BamB